MQDDSWRTAAIDTELADILTAAVPNDELKELSRLTEYRDAVIGEATAQCNNLLNYFSAVLGFKATTYRYTYMLGAVAELVGLGVAMHYKGRFLRPRPSRLFPQLLPPIEVPGHAAFPSGHATQSMLIALCLAKVMPDAVKLPLITLPDSSKVPYGPVFRLAERIGRNREVLGLHYPSDSKAGRALAAHAFTALQTVLDAIKQPQTGAPPYAHPLQGLDLITLATAEWQ